MIVEWIQSPWIQPDGRPDLDEDPPWLVRLPFAFAVAFFAHSNAAVCPSPWWRIELERRSGDEAKARVAEGSGEREERMGACAVEAWPETFYKAFHRVADWWTQAI